MRDDAGDLLESLIAEASSAALKTSAQLDERLDECILVAMTEAAVSARDPDRRSVAEGLAGASLREGSWHHDGDQTGRAAALAYLTHADLADDAYRLAHHPSLSIVPVALVHGMAVGADGPRFRHAVRFGYELSCRLADSFLPDISQRGWRVAAALAAPVAAAVSSCLRGSDADAILQASRLGFVNAGCFLYSVHGAEWAIQPALGVASGIFAERATRAGFAPTRDVFTCLQGPFDHMGGATAPTSARGDAEASSRLPEVVFKRYCAPAYGQAIYEAIRGHEVDLAHARHLTIRVPPFAAEYGRQQAVRNDSVASIEGLARRALQHFGVLSGLPGPHLRIDVVSDEAVPDDSARIIAGFADRPDLDVERDGFGWMTEHQGVVRRCEDRLNSTLDGLPENIHALRQSSDLTGLDGVFRRLIEHRAGAVG